jgi:hypothetical protein
MERLLLITPKFVSKTAQHFYKNTTALSNSS